jgi:hypothetical protein
LRPHKEARVHSGLRDARRGQSWHRRPRDPVNGPIERRRRTWTHSSTEGRSKGAHAVEFSKTVAPRQEGASSSGGRPGAETSSRSGQMSIARGWPGWKEPDRPRLARRTHTGCPAGKAQPHNSAVVSGSGPVSPARACLGSAPVCLGSAPSPGRARYAVNVSPEAWSKASSRETFVEDPLVSKGDHREVPPEGVPVARDRGPGAARRLSAATAREGRRGDGARGEVRRRRARGVILRFRRGRALVPPAEPAGPSRASRARAPRAG